MKTIHATLTLISLMTLNAQAIWHTRCGAYLLRRQSQERKPIYKNLANPLAKQLYDGTTTPPEKTILPQKNRNIAGLLPVKKVPLWKKIFCLA